MGLDLVSNGGFEIAVNSQYTAAAVVGGQLELLNASLFTLVQSVDGHALWTGEYYTLLPGPWNNDPSWFIGEPTNCHAPMHACVVVGTHSAIEDGTHVLL